MHLPNLVIGTGRCNFSFFDLPFHNPEIDKAILFVNVGNQKIQLRRFNI
jgi:hypothetical protein